ncbi:hypothetical protein RB195_013029 [Necator americanus]
MHPHVLSKSANIRSVWLMLDLIRTMSSAKPRWRSCRPSTVTPTSSLSNFLIALSRVVLNILAKHSNRKESPDSGGKPGTVAPGRTGLRSHVDYQNGKGLGWRLTYNARTLASEAAIEDLMMQAKKIKYDAIGLTETRRRHPLNAVYETGEELFLGTCDSRGVGGVGVLVNTSMAKNIDSFEQLTTRIGRLRMRRCGPIPALTILFRHIAREESSFLWT